MLPFVIYMPSFNVLSGYFYVSPPRGTALYLPYRYVPPQRVWFLGRFGLKTDIAFASFGLSLGMVFEGFRGWMDLFVV